MAVGHRVDWREFPPPVQVPKRSVTIQRAKTQRPFWSAGEPEAIFLDLARLSVEGGTK